MHSLQSKLGTGLVLSLIAVFTVLWLLINSGIQYLSEEYIASRLQHDTEMLLRTISLDANNQISLNESAIDPVYNRPFSGHYFQISTAQQVIRSRSLWDQQLNSINATTGESKRERQPGPDQQSLLVLSSGFRKHNRQLTIMVAAAVDPVNRNIGRFQIWFASSAAGMLLLLVILQALILRNSLKSLSHLRNELQALQQGKLEFLHTEVPVEIRPLVTEVNHLHKVMAERLRRSRDALGDLAHALKKPLTIIQQFNDRYRESMPADVHETLVKQSAEINRLTDRILKRARLAGNRQQGTRFSLSLDLPDLISTLEMMYPDKDIKMYVDNRSETEYLFDREDMMELLGNLVDNAYKWARHAINITIDRKSGDEIEISIEDDGPGADLDQLKQILRRGVRLDETVHGYGFGLAIVSDMLAEYKGSIVFGRSDKLGGFRVEITLPMQHSEQAGKAPA